MRSILMFLFIAAAAFSDNSAQADPYPWCAVYRNGSSNCYFMTLEQCWASVSGLGGFCNPSGYYDGRPVTGSGEFVRRGKSLGKLKAGSLVGNRG